MPVHTPPETAELLGVSPSQLRKLTAAGAIGHVRLGLGTVRSHIGYSDAHIADFLAARDVAPRTAEPTTGPIPGTAPASRSRRRKRHSPPDTAAQVAAAHVATATRWEG